jgi:predicted nuclease with TOPRIM domain
MCLENIVALGLDMKLRKGRSVLATLLAGLILTLLVLAPSAQALTLNYSDSIWATLSVTGPDITKPGNSEVYTVQGRLAANMTGSVRLSLTLNSTAGATVALLSATVLASGNYITGNSFIQSYNVVIPSDAANNKYIYATVEAGASHLNTLVVSLVQSPTYGEQQTLIAQLQANVTDLSDEINSLKAQLNDAQAGSEGVQEQLESLNQTYNSLLNNYNSLINSSNSDKSDLLRQIGDLQNQTSNLNSTIASLTSQIASLQSENSQLQLQLNQAQADSASLAAQIEILQGNNTGLENALNSTQGDKDSLLSQISDLQNQNNRLTLNNSNLKFLAETYSNQTEVLQAQISDLQAQNSTTNIMLYLALFVAAAFIAATAYIVFIVVKGKGRKKAEDQLY